jgi:hypothetical protein
MCTLVGNPLCGYSCCSSYVVLYTCSILTTITSASKLINALTADRAALIYEDSIFIPVRHPPAHADIVNRRIYK